MDKKLELSFYNRSYYYKKVFETEEGKAVLADLANFIPTSASEGTGANPVLIQINSGKQLVLSRILKFVNMNIEQLEKLVEEQNKMENI